jgi:purine catabolism regulator
LLNIGLERSQALDLAERQLRVGAFHLLQAGQADAARPIVRELAGGLPREPVRLVALSGQPERRAAAIELLKSEATRLREIVFYADLEEITIVAIADAHPVGAWLLDLPRRVTGLALGLSDPTDYDHFMTAHRQAVQAAEAGQRDGSPVTRFAELSKGGMTSFMEPKRAEAFSASLLEPLIRHDQVGRGDLVNSLHVWLEHHGQWDPAAARLGVHRHTLRHRIQKAQQLLDRPLDSPTVRAELWLALKIHTSPRH